MSEFEYPREITDKNFQTILERANKIKKRTRYLDVISFVLTAATIILIMYPIFWYYRVYSNSGVEIVVSWLFLIASGFSIMLSTVFIDVVRVVLRRMSYAISHYPTSEECVFCECVYVANRLIKNKVYSKDYKDRYLSATWRVRLLCEEISLYTKDPFNLKRRLYAPEFDLLSHGANQMSRMFVFSSMKISDWLLNFGLAFVKNDDIIAHRYLKKIMAEAEKFGKLESFSKRIENQIVSIRGIIALIGGIIAIVGGILTIITTLL